MRVLVACEYSGVVRDAFRKLGHDAWSCDIIPTESDPAYHYQCDVREVLTDKWDMIIAFPPCTHLAASGAKHFAQKIADGRQQQGIEFFMLFANHKCSKIAIENSIGIMSSNWRKPDQIIQPWMFGHPESKKTCLWLKGLDLLKPTNIVKAEMEKLPINQQQRIHYLSPSKDRSKIRSKTYQGIAEAMAQQWGNVELIEKGKVG